MSNEQEESVQEAGEQETKKIRLDWRKIGIGSGITAAVGFFLFLIWFASCVTNVDNYELGFVFDRYTGKIEEIEKKGWVVRMPVRYSVHTLDLRPYQLTINANQRVLNAKLVRFNPEGLDTFVEWHGRSAGDNLSDLKDILMCYAFDPTGGKDCPFLEVISEISPSQSAMVPKRPVTEEKR